MDRYLAPGPFNGLAPGTISGLAPGTISSLARPLPPLKVATMCGRIGGSRVYQLIASDGTTALTGWGPADDVLKPIRHVPEGKVFADAVEVTGSLRLHDVLGRTLNRLDACRIAENLSGPRKGQTRAMRTAIYRQGGVRYFRTLRLAADYLGMSRQDLAWRVHRLPNLAIFHDVSNRARAGAVRRQTKH